MSRKRSSSWPLWDVLTAVLIGMALAQCATGQNAREDEGYIQVEVMGRLNSQVMAIGGETTGTQITAAGITWELDLGDDPERRSLAEALHEKDVVVTGTLRVMQGVEIPMRWIVTVATLRAADESGRGTSDRDTSGGGTSDRGAIDRGSAKEPTGAGGESSYVDSTGKLLHALVLKDAQGGFAGYSGQVWTIEPGGAWRRQPFLNETVREADASGRIDPSRIGVLVEQLEKHDLAGLPKEIGKTDVNPHVFTITFGGQATSLVLRGGAELPEAGDARSAEQRFAAIARAVMEATKAE